MDAETPLVLTYPADGGTKTINIGDSVFDFYNGVVRSPGVDDDDTSDSLKNRQRRFCRSLLIYTDQDLKISFDGSGKFTITAGKWTRYIHQEFKRLYLTATTSTAVKVVASTHNQGVPEVT